MPQPLFLHIQSRRRAPARVIPLAGSIVRIGRGADCEARLDDPSLGEVECLLRLQGESWHIQPLSDRGKISIDGRPVTHLRAVAANVPLKVGEFSLVLRDREKPAPAFGTIEVPPVPNAGAIPRYSAILEDDLLAVRVREEPARPEPTRGASRTPIDREVATKLWEARWRAAARSLRSKGRPHSEPSAERARPVEPVTVRFPSPSEPIPAPEAEVVATPAEFLAEALGDVSPETDKPPMEEPPVHEPPEEMPPVEIPPGEEPTPEAPPVEVPQVEPPPSGVPPMTDEAEAVCCWADAPFAPEAVVSTVTEFAPAPGPEAASSQSLVDAGSVPAAPSTPEAPSPEPRGLRVETRGATLLNASTPEPSRRPSRPRPAPIAPRSEPPIEEHWPSARDILAARRPAAPRRAPAAKAPRSRPMPTPSVEPRPWMALKGLTWLASFAATLLLGFVGVYLSFQWAADDREAGSLADRLLKASATPIEPIDEEEINPDATWWKTTGPHLGLKAAALGMTRGGASRRETTRFVLDAARSAAPLEPSSRLARAEMAGDGDADPLAALGLSRDAVSLALTGRALARRGKAESALAAYRSALEIAAQGGSAKGQTPIYLDEPTAHRFALPGESLALGIIREMAAQSGWTPAAWTPALPDHGVILLAGYRVLKEKNAPESQAVLNRLIESGQAPALGDPAFHAAARAEALAVAGRASDADALYAEAIDRVSDPALRRTWHLNRGVILARGGQDDRAKDAMQAARAGRGDDEIGRRVAEAMNREGMTPKASTAEAASGMYKTRAN